MKHLPSPNYQGKLHKEVRFTLRKFAPLTGEYLFENCSNIPKKILNISQLRICPEKQVVTYI